MEHVIPFAALLACAVFAGAAGGFPACVKPKDPADKAFPSLDALLRCQRGARKRFQASLKLPPGSLPRDEQWDRLDDFQRAEVREFLKRHPERASHEEDAAQTPPVSSSTSSARDRDLDMLSTALQARSDGGKKGITPEMAREVVEYLKEKQGGTSPDMTELLGAVAADGANLSEATMSKLRRAARAAKSQGLDLGVDPDIERELLKPDAPASEPRGGASEPPALPPSN